MFHTKLLPNSRLIGLQAANINAGNSPWSRVNLPSPLYFHQHLTIWPFSRDAFCKYDWQDEGRTSILWSQAQHFQFGFLWVFSISCHTDTPNEELVSKSCQPDAFVVVIWVCSGNLRVKSVNLQRRNPYCSTNCSTNCHSCAKFRVVCQVVEGRVLCTHCVCQVRVKISKRQLIEVQTGRTCQVSKCKVFWVMLSKSTST